MMNFLIKKNEKEIQSLNGIRTLAIVLVMITHSWGFANRILPEHLIDSAIANTLLNFVSGVDLFLILSGFLISLRLKEQWRKQNTLNFKDFYTKRALRIFPAYYSFLIISIILFNLMDTPYNKRNILMDFLYLANYFKGQMPHTWTLAMEEQFYLVFPFVAWILLFRVSWRIRITALLILYILPFCFRYFSFHNGIHNINEYEFKIYLPAHTRYDALISGILLMELYTEKKEQIKKTANMNGILLIFSIGLLYIAHAFRPDYSYHLFHAIKYNLLNIGYGILFFIVLSENPISRFFSWKFFRPVARVSYTMYLWQFIFGGIGLLLSGLKFSEFSWVLFFLCFLVIFFSTFLLSILAFYGIEYPFLKWKQRQNK